MSPKRVLLVEDDNDDEVLMIRALKKNKVANEVIVARDGVEALNRLFGNGSRDGKNGVMTPDVILLDLQLPRLGGLKVLEKIRSNERTRLIPVVVLTSSKEDKDVLDAYKLGADSYVQKSMVLMIEDLLDLSRIARRKVHPTEVDLSALAIDVTSGLRGPEPGRKVEFIIQDGLRTRGDAGLLRTLLETLVRNALNYVPAGSVQRIEIGSLAEEGRESFFVRGEGNFTGSSKGLASVYRIVSQHGGKVWTRCGTDGSMTFHFTLRVKQGVSHE